MTRWIFGIFGICSGIDFPISTIYLRREWISEYIPEGLASARGSAFNTRHDWLEYGSDSDMYMGITPLKLAIREVKSLSALSDRIAIELSILLSVVRAIV